MTIINNIIILLNSFLYLILFAFLYSNINFINIIPLSNIKFHNFLCNEPQITY